MRLVPAVRSVPVAARCSGGVVTLALVALAFLFLPSPPVQPQAARPASIPPAHPLVFFDDRAFAVALARVEAADPNPIPGARAVIVPHHWLAT